jgi:hypothetical protein
VALVDDLRSEIEAARAELVDAVAGMTEADLVRRPASADGGGEEWCAADVLWHVGLVEDWFRRMILQSTLGRPIAAFLSRPRPAHLANAELLVAWVDQTRRPLLALMRRLDDAALEREFVLPEGEVRTPRRLIAYLARHDREHAEQVRALRGLAAAGRE